jgi:acyl-ACP thioesterase
MDNFWCEERIINWEETSLNGRLSLRSLSLILVNSAIKSAESLGFGFSRLILDNASWVLYKLNIKIERLPLHNEKIKVITWPRDFSAITASREFQIFSSVNDELLVSATSDWLIINLETRKPQRMSRFMTDEYLNPNSNVLDQNFPIFPSNDEFEEVFSQKAQYSDLDMNGHVIASKYFEWVDNAIYETHGEKELDFMQIHYLHECKLGENISIRVSKEDYLCFEGLKINTNKAAFRSVIKLKGK